MPSDPVGPSSVVGGKCRDCSAFTYPPGSSCRLCGAEIEAVRLAGTGRLQAWTVIRVAPESFEAPYVIGYAVLDEGPRVLVRINENPEDLSFDAVLQLTRTSLQTADGRHSQGLEAALDVPALEALHG
jgi:uncharacterized OB-fold protein